MAGDLQHHSLRTDARSSPLTQADVDAIVVAAPVLIWSASASGGHEWLSSSWVLFTGIPECELAGMGWTRTVHSEDLERCVGIQATSFEAAHSYSLDVRLRRRDGEYRWMFENCVPRRGSAGETIGFVGTLVDIHERKLLEEALAGRAQQLRLAERRQGQFLAMLSHELRNPLAPIANAASVLRTLEHSNPILVRLREILDRQVARMRHLIEDLIDVTRAAQGQITLVRETVSIESVVQAAVASSHDEINGGGHRLAVDMPAERLMVRGDRARLAQALAHVVGNAAKFSFDPGVVEISVRRVEKTAQIVVRDRGHGIDPAFLPQAFELFAQQDQTLARSLGGLGVGLTLARRVARLHGGDVEGHSEGPGHGSEFVLWLPLLEDEQAGISADDGAPRLGDSLRVLIIEDDPDALESLRLQMELWGTQVSAARSAAEAMSLAAQVRPQIVLCDLGLPGMDGLALVRELRRTLAGQPVLFAAVTGYAGTDEQERALAAGYDSFFVKPLDSEGLARLLRSHADRVQ